MALVKEKALLGINNLLLGHLALLLLCELSPADPIDCVFLPQKLINFSEAAASFVNGSAAVFRKWDSSLLIRVMRNNSSPQGRTSYFFSSSKLCTAQSGSLRKKKKLLSVVDPWDPLPLRTVVTQLLIGLRDLPTISFGNPWFSH